MFKETTPLNPVMIHVNPAHKLKSYFLKNNFNIKKNSVALVRERTVPTERPPPVGEVSANFCG